MFLDFGHYVWFGPIIFTLADLTAIKENVRWHYVTAKCIEFLVNDNWTILIYQSVYQYQSAARIEKKSHII